MAVLTSKLAVALWGSDAKDRALLAKLDFTLLPYFSLIWFLFGVTRSSYSSAYISGMKEALGFEGKQYNYMNTAYLVVYAVCQMPGTSLLTVARPKYVFVAANVTWSILTLITFKMTHAWQVILLNAIEGGFSAIAYVGAQFILGSWYKKSELGTRTAVFCVFGQLGTMAGGWIQAGLLQSLSGKSGLPAWKWIFIIVSVMTLPVAFFGWIFIPDLPAHRVAWYLTDEQKEHAATRLGATRKQAWDLTVVKRIFLSWQFYLLPFIFMLYSLCVQMLQNNVMAYWMASRGYTTVQQNNYPTGIYAAAILGTVVYAVISDKLRSRWEVSIAIGLTFIIGSAILVADPPTAGYFFAFYLLGTTFAPQAVWYSWMADVTSHDLQLRAITTGFMNSFDFAFVTWWPLIFYPATDAPNFRKGYIASLVTGALTLPFIGLITYLEKRDTAKGLIGRVPIEEQLNDEQEYRTGSPDDGLQSKSAENVRSTEVNV
ncbi:major facilitator superfamily domain-containing protein [Talaromyces proteolyticus]|uniref:Major facilitator superfamily domain-containing protein n=1 Tax=Talaromyces proteolyticus TaxID=1131652 RepID=A0AAD4PW83_9EURO|nr:major facilitator superfamily domain-containing protein [Talaromyces proteolyticus]KAH8691627.1 major facilitator superfamily domain-containing protein [Talaromyces proteolyticus]